MSASNSTSAASSVAAPSGVPSRPVIVWLARHGETTWNQSRRIQGWSDIPLSNRGREQARTLAFETYGGAFDRVWSSDLGRAVETAEIIPRPPQTDVRLRELHFGELEGLTWDDLHTSTQEALMEFDGFSAPGGESVEVMRRRAVAFVDELVPGTHLVVTHAGIIRVLLWACGIDDHPEPGQLSTVDWTNKEAGTHHAHTRTQL